MNKYIFILTLAALLLERGETMPVPELADLLNQNGFQTSYGDDYKGGRGTYTLISAVYSWLMSEGRQQEANQVAEAFTKPDGTFAYA